MPTVVSILFCIPSYRQNTDKVSVSLYVVHVNDQIIETVRQGILLHGTNDTEQYTDV